MSDIYEQHRAAFARFEAFVILDAGEIARVSRSSSLPMARDAGQHWDGALRDAGFTVVQAV